MPTPSAFARALDEYVNSRPKNSETPKFIQTLQEQQRTGSPLDGEAIKKDIIQLERNASDRKAARAARKVLQPVVNIMSTYTGVVDTLVQADPMPTAVIWGCLRAVISCSQRFLELYSKIADQIKRLNDHISVLTLYEDMFGDSSIMQELLQVSYIGIIRFWRRVEKECNRCVTNRMLRAVAPFSTSKIDDIITSIGNTADDMNRLIPVVQERLDRGERENAAEERRLAGIARDEQKLLFQMCAEDLKKRNEERKQRRQKEVQDWLRDRDPLLNESNFRHQDNKYRARSPGTCDWLVDHDTMKGWIDGSNPASQLSIQASPGAGKSVLAAYAIEKLAHMSPDGSAVIYQYFTFDDEFPTLLVYRCLAEQLANRLGKHTADMPEDIHTFTQQGATVAKGEDVKTVFKMLLERTPMTYIFLDGLDEMCETEARRNALSDVLDFLQELATQMPHRVRLWCSSQSRTCLDTRLSSLPTIEVTKNLNSGDIETYLSNTIVDLDSLDLDQGYKNLILEEVREKADGCFLWASLMLQSMSNAITLQMVQELIEDGLPQSYERYYQRKMEAIEPSLREFVSILLACILHAKRPLRLEELCECTALVRGNEGHNMNTNEKLVKSKVLQLCQPLVQIHESHSDGETICVCTLTHGSVKSFLLKSPQILSHYPGSTAYDLKSNVIANICLKYLLQPRYRRLLAKKGGTYVDVDGGDIMDHHLLSYSAKYWDKHLDSVEFSPGVCQSVSRFIVSPQFFTLLQVQSLFIEGQFTTWLSRFRSWAGEHFRRTFPYWLEANCQLPLTEKYVLFVGEWGHLLSNETRHGMPLAGEIDRCFFGALGHDSYLHDGPSRYRSLKFLTEDHKPDIKLLRCFDGVDESGTRLVVLKLDMLHPERLQFSCERWRLQGHHAKAEGTQTLSISPSSWPLYEYPLTEKVLGRPRFVSFTKDLQFMRVGSQLFSKGDDHEYKPTSVREDYFEEMTNGGHFVAVTTRRPITETDIEFPEETGNQEAVVDYADTMLQELKAKVETLDEQAAAVTAAAESTQPTTVDTEATGTDSDSGSSATSVSEYAPEAEALSEKDSDVQSDSGSTDELLFASSSESAGNSAYTSWSEGTTELMSDEVEGEEDQWNDYNDKKLNPEELDIDDRGSFHSDDALSFEDKLESDLSESDNDSDALLRRSDTDFPPPSSSSGRYSASDESNSENGGSDGAHLEDLMLGKRTAKAEGSKRTSIRVYDTTRLDSVPVFHYTCFVKGDLFDSPPAFHPSKPLVVWPLGDGEILFANYQNNTYFTRELCRSQHRSCHVFIKSHFSSDGQHLHFAALEAYKADEEESFVNLSVQVSTHRLSLRKTASSPPRLIFRTTVSLASTSTIEASNLPFSVSWTEKELFFSTRQRKLDVIRIPLFRAPQSESPTTVCYLKDPVFLPGSIKSRSMHFFPAPEGSTKSTTGKKPKKSATLIFGSYCSLPSQGVLVPKNMCDPPIAVFLRDSTDLVWTCKTDSEENVDMSVVNAASGRLKGKFESFDHNEDCDIVPYLF
ncbi:hypothetical protein BJX99DRAFT_202881 [Aspergillus californicus]